jgi:hypothetical protein
MTMMPRMRMDLEIDDIDQILSLEIRGFIAEAARGNDAGPVKPDTTYDEVWLDRRTECPLQANRLRIG